MHVHEAAARRARMPARAWTVEAETDADCARRRLSGLERRAVRCAAQRRRLLGVRQLFHDKRLDQAAPSGRSKEAEAAARSALGGVDVGRP
eukprot:3086826-Pleurochrysis_carterae.AAC.1